jgi:hypothetical protein
MHFRCIYEMCITISFEVVGTMLPDHFKPSKNKEIFLIFFSIRVTTVAHFDTCIGNRFNKKMGRNNNVES